MHKCLRCIHPDPATAVQQELECLNALHKFESAVLCSVLTIDKSLNLFIGLFSENAIR